ncbi:hypothetical protein IH992_09715 [Candidatus Poribacteria bacterium]|nr:hypothetical protein [Candidatus Poribacteria bacterium]
MNINWQRVGFGESEFLGKPPPQLDFVVRRLIATERQLRKLRTYQNRIATVV